MLIFYKPIEWFWRGYGEQTSLLSEDPGSKLQEMGQYPGKVKGEYKKAKYAHHLERCQGWDFK